MMGHNVLVLNCGSSSIKYQLVNPGTGVVPAGGTIERIGQKDGTITHQCGDQKFTVDGPIADHSVGITLMRKMFADSGTSLDDSGIVAVGHRVVHGGARFCDPVLLDDATVAAIEELSVLAPLHNPANVIGIQRARAAFPTLPQVAVFDTAFFRDLPAAASTYAIDHKLAAAHQIRRYGFHGTSHQYVAGQVAKYLERDPADINQIILHLGNGASISAISGGAAIETSMGMTPLEGLVMGTRSGDIDPGVLFHLHRVAGLSVTKIDALLNRRSGMLGLSGVSDFRDLHSLIQAGDAGAQLALDVYCHRAKKYVGAYYAVLGSVDAITFTAGVGENDSVVRDLIMRGLAGLGISIDPVRNEVRSSESRVISPVGSPVTLLVVPTNEELAIARATLALVE